MHNAPIVLVSVVDDVHVLFVRIDNELLSRATGSVFA